jgi:hypothetical protein
MDGPLSLHFGKGMLEEAIVEAKAVRDILGPRLYAVELGNEVENYGRGKRSAATAPVQLRSLSPSLRNGAGECSLPSRGCALPLPYRGFGALGRNDGWRPGPASIADHALLSRRSEAGHARRADESGPGAEEKLGRLRRASESSVSDPAITSAAVLWLAAAALESRTGITLGGSGIDKLGGPESAKRGASRAPSRPPSRGPCCCPPSFLRHGLSLRPCQQETHGQKVLPRGFGHGYTLDGPPQYIFDQARFPMTAIDNKIAGLKEDLTKAGVTLMSAGFPPGQLMPLFEYITVAVGFYLACEERLRITPAADTRSSTARRLSGRKKTALGPACLSPASLP